MEIITGRAPPSHEPMCSLGSRQGAGRWLTGWPVVAEVTQAAVDTQWIQWIPRAPSPRLLAFWRPSPSPRRYLRSVGLVLTPRHGDLRGLPSLSIACRWTVRNRPCPQRPQHVQPGRTAVRLARQLCEECGGRGVREEGGAVNSGLSLVDALAHRRAWSNHAVLTTCGAVHPRSSRSSWSSRFLPYNRAARAGPRTTIVVENGEVVGPPCRARALLPGGLG